MSDNNNVPHPPSIHKTRFNCPHCGAFAHQEWYDLLGIKKGSTPDVPTCITLALKRPLSRAGQFVENLYFCKCHSCDGISVWAHYDIIYPDAEYKIFPNPDLPEEIQQTFKEAASILYKSPRGAAALLRLAVQKLCIHLGKNININKAIGELVTDGLSPRIQQALDVVRVIGNEAVHPGTIDIKDNIEIATSLFKLVNIIAEKMISEPKHIEAMFADLPENKIDAIEKRDKKSTE